jgi:Prokaryotic E2 family E
VGDPNSRVAEELELLRRNFPELEYLVSGHWVRIPRYGLPDSIWDRDHVEVCFQIPEQIPGQAPYGFYVRPNLALESAQPIGNYAYPAPTGFGGDWGKFSWQLTGWTPTADLVSGTNMVNFVRSFVDRFTEGA